MFNKGQIVKGWRISIRKEFATLLRRGIHKDRFTLPELSKILGESEDLIHEYLSVTASNWLLYHTKDKILHLDPYDNQFIVYKDGKKQRVEDA